MKRLVEKWKALFTVCLIFWLVGCNSGADRVSKYDGVTNVREIAGDYMLYEIENGTVTCREHRRRDELACWKN